MAEDWSAIAAEVDEAIRSIADVGQGDGFPIALRKDGAAAGNPWNPTPGAPTVVTLYGFETTQELRDANGTLIGQTKRTLTVSALPGIVPSDDDEVALGVSEGDVTDETAFEEILAVRPLAPVGIAVLYEIDLAT